jgi:hypothetical protein
VVENGARHRPEQGAGYPPPAAGPHADQVERLLANQLEDLLGRVAAAQQGGYREILRKGRRELAQARLGLLRHLIGKPLGRHARGGDGGRRIRDDGEQRQP